ncbi:hypothetical protein BJ508DRAFT_301642 [Ascobolus immersus RN42]|uniref:Uncharacterized protein n=1 Tax=Ascobolus immersus RN42 TaxID=1160509 RepID=A0A3N4IRI2_ASCIM|nr:hypothetical protein BJ508DRAFT_301642 [Ascobolus immersus RN42]
MNMSTITKRTTGAPVVPNPATHVPMPTKPTNIWQIMNYPIPRGKCNSKTSVISSCPCLRFMLNPLQAASTFVCDGCGHHASFHQMKNEGEEDSYPGTPVDKEVVNGVVNGSSKTASGKRRIVIDGDDDEEMQVGKRSRS